MIFLFLPLILSGSASAWNSQNEHNCTAPRSPENGLSYIFQYGDIVRYVCHPGYKMIGVSVVHCVNSEWTHPPPECHKIRRYDHSSNQILTEGTTNYHNRRDHRNSRTRPTTSDSDLQMVNWKQATNQQNVYGDGAKRLPLINGIWPPQEHVNQVLALGPQSTPGPRAFVREEIDIAELRNRQLEELKRRRYNATAGTGKRRLGRKKNKRKHAVVIDESIPRETILSLGSTEDGQAFSVAHAKPLYESTKPPHKHRHRHGEKKSGGTKKPRNYDPVGYSVNVVYVHTPRFAGAIEHHKLPINNNVFEAKHRPIEHVQPDFNSSRSQPNSIQEQKPPTNRGGEGFHRRRPFVGPAEPSRNIIGQFSYFDSSCLEIVQRREVPKIAPQIQDGFVYSYVSRKNKEFPFNSFMAVLYKCNNGYVLVNNEHYALYCYEREWIGEMPRCIKQSIIN